MIIAGIVAKVNPLDIPHFFWGVYGKVRPRWRTTVFQLRFTGFSLLSGREAQGEEQLSVVGLAAGV
jgi:hypothetical protein